MTGREFNVGIGLNSGDLIVGYLGSARALSYTVIGHNVNFASRLCDMARGGEILMGTKLYERVADRVLAAKREAIKIKGIVQPLSVYKFLEFK